MIDTPGEVLAGLAALFGGGIGLYAMFSPDWAARIVRLEPANGSKEGRSEFRSSYGGLFFLGHALGFWFLVAGSTGAAAGLGVLGAGWLGSALGRCLSFVLDRTATPANWANVAIEAVLGGCLLAPLLSA